MQSYYGSLENFSSLFCLHKIKLWKKRNCFHGNDYSFCTKKECYFYYIIPTEEPEIMHDYEHLKKNIQNICVVNQAFCAYSNRFWTFLIDGLMFTCKFIMVEFQNGRFSSCDFRTTVFRKTMQSMKEQVVVVTQVTPLISNLVWQVITFFLILILPGGSVGMSY